MASTLCGGMTVSLLPAHGSLGFQLKNPRHRATSKQAAAVRWSALDRSGFLTGAQLSGFICSQGTATQHGRPHKRTLNTVFAALPLAPPSLHDMEERRRISEEYGFTQIGEPVPDDVTLKKVMDTLPQEVFKIDDIKAWKSVAISVAAYSLGLYLIAKAPWYLLPLAWAWTGTAVTGFFVIGHDCAHKSFSKNKLVEDIVGTLSFLPLIYPYEPWRFKHDRHHSKTNM